MNIQVIIQVSADVAKTFTQQGSPTAEAQAILKIVRALGILLEPVYPGTEDPLLVLYFMVEVPNSKTADWVIAHLRQSKAIEAAYIKPPDESP